jgi:hypothetical protein
MANRTLNIVNSEASTSVNVSRPTAAASAAAYCFRGALFDDAAALTADFLTDAFAFFGVCFLVAAIKIPINE